MLRTISSKKNKSDLHANERLYRRIVVELIKRQQFAKLLDHQLFESELISLSIYPETDLFNVLMKRQLEFVTNIEDILLKKLNY
jgi:hypothetical protein